MTEKQDRIEEEVIGAVLAGKLAPGARLVEGTLARLYKVSRTRVREALMRLQTRGIVEVSSRRGWFVVEPSAEEAHAVYQARKVIETGLMLSIGRIPDSALAHLRRHVAEEHAMLTDVRARVCLLGDFHVHLAELTGNPVLVAIVRDLTARTTLISMLYQPARQAEESSDDHAAILDALAAGDTRRACDLMAAHLDRVEAGLDLGAPRDPLAGLRRLLSPRPHGSDPDPMPSISEKE